MTGGAAILPGCSRVAVGTHVSLTPGGKPDSSVGIDLEKVRFGGGRFHRSGDAIEEPIGSGRMPDMRAGVTFEQIAGPIYDREAPEWDAGDRGVVWGHGGRPDGYVRDRGRQEAGRNARVHGSKNAALPLMCPLLTGPARDSPDVPGRISRSLRNLLAELGCIQTGEQPGVMRLHTQDPN